MERRDQLVLAAFGRVADVGFEGLRLRQVADDVGIDHSTLHHHFATKQDLVAAVAEYATRQFWSTAPSATEPAAALREHLLALRRVLDEWPGLFAVTVELDLRARRDPAVAAAMAGYESGWRELLIGLLAARPWADPADAAAAAELVIAGVKGVRLAPHLAPPVFAQLHALLTDDEEEDLL